MFGLWFCDLMAIGGGKLLLRTEFDTRKPYNNLTWRVWWYMKRCTQSEGNNWTQEEV